ncbi:hypothetical protein PC111_g16210 [Phytophthora cactorum]|nr:hypothetical protein PC111_g16210 [Phytophthora cactorum]
MASASSYQLAPAMIKTTDYTWNSALTNIDGDVGHWITHNLDEELASSVAEPVPFREYGGRGDVDTIGRGGRGGVRGSSGISLTASEAVQGGGASWHRGRDCRRGVRGTGNAALAVVNVNHACDSSGRGGRGCRGSRSIGSVAHTTSNDKQLAVGLESVVVATVEVETPRLSLLLLAMFAELAAALSPAIVGASVAQAVLRLVEKTEIWATIEAGLVGVVVALSGSSALMDGALLVVLCVAVRLLLPHADRSGTNDGQDV